jgi:hypothetical protein
MGLHENPIWNEPWRFPRGVARADPLALAFLLPLLTAHSRSSETELTVVSFNLRGAGANEGKPLDDTLAVFRAHHLPREHEKAGGSPLKGLC